MSKPSSRLRRRYCGDSLDPKFLQQAALNHCCRCSLEHRDLQRVVTGAKMVFHRRICLVLHCKAVAVHTFPEGATSLPNIDCVAFGMARGDDVNAQVKSSWTRWVLFVLYRKVSILRTTSHVLQRATSHGKVPFGLSLDEPSGSARGRQVRRFRRFPVGACRQPGADQRCCAGVNLIAVLEATPLAACLTVVDGSSICKPEGSGCCYRWSCARLELLKIWLLGILWTLVSWDLIRSSEYPRAFKKSVSSARRSSKLASSETMAGSRMPRPNGRWRWTWGGWSLDGSKYWCVSLGFVKRSDVIDWPLILRVASK